MLEEGLEGTLSSHFGHASSFTVLSYDEPSKQVINVKTVGNVSHQQNGCMVPVKILKDADVNFMILGGIGMRPLQYFIQEGIQPFLGINGSVKENFEAFMNKQLKPLDQGTCGGGSH